MRFVEFDLISDALCMGERIKGGLFRPCARTIRYSQISGALRKKFGLDDIHAAGYLLEANGYNKVSYFVYSPRDKSRDISKVPLQVEFLSNVRGRVYVVENDFTRGLPHRFEIFMGALISKGFGLCQLTKRRAIELVPSSIKRGILKTRIPLDKQKMFGIRKLFTPVYGYLFEPTCSTTGIYVLSLFEGSDVIGPEFLVSMREGS